MGYGNGMRSLSPCSAEDTLALLRRHAPDAKKILDAGCGRGDTLALLAEKIPDAELSGLEPDAENAFYARESCPGAEILELSAEEFAENNKSEKFSAVLAECVFSLMDGPRRGAAALRGLLASGGVLLLSDLYLPDGMPGGQVSDGIIKNVYTKRDIEGFFAETGLELLAFYDRRSDMLALAGQMIMDGTFCDCVDAAAFAALRRLRAGYGVWVFGEAEK